MGSLNQGRAATHAPNVSTFGLIGSATPATKAASKNKTIIIFAGGALLTNSPASAQTSGFDLIATDATAALQALRRLLGLAAPNPSPRF